MPTQSTQPAETPAPEASSTPASATPNSFSEVTDKLDAGGDFYLYISTAQWLANLSQGIDSLHQLMLSHATGQTPEQQQQADAAFALLNDIVQKSGLEDISGIGASSFNYAPGLHRNKIFVHHYPANGAGLIWTLHGKQPHPLSDLDILPADTALGGVGDFDLAQLVTFLRQEVNQSGTPDMQQTVAQWDKQFAGLFGVKIDDVLQSLNGSFGMVLTLDSTETMSIPVAGHMQTIPSPRLALLIAVKNDLIFKLIDKMAAGMPGMTEADDADARMLLATLPPNMPINARPTLAQWNGFLVIASDDKLVRDMIAVQKGGPGLKSTPEYATLSAGLPEQGNGFGIATQRFAETLRSIQTQMMANSPGVDPSQAALFQRFQKVGHVMSIGAVLPNGYLSISQGSQGTEQLIAPLLIAPAALAASIALPAYTGVQDRAKETASLSKAKQLGLACKLYAVDNNGAFPPSLDALFPTYIQDRSILVSPLMPNVPDGYNYTPGLKDTDPPDTIVIEDKFAPLKHVRIVVYVDGSGKVLRTN